MSTPSQSSRICSLLYDLARNENGRNVQIDLNGVPVLVIQRREDADHVLRTHVGNYSKNMAWFRQVLGASRFSEDGKAWEIRRDLTQPYFSKFNRQHTFNLAAYYGLEALDSMVARSEAGHDTLDDTTLRQMAANVLVHNFFGIRLADTGIDLGLLAELMEFGSEYAFVPAGKTRDLYQSRLATLPELRRQVLDSLHIFREGNLPENPMLEAMLAADRDPEQQVVLEHELMTFLAAGAETTAATVGWASYLLALNPEVQEELRSLAQAFWRSGQANWENLSRLKPLDLFISETLRLYPPTPIIARLANGPDRIGEHEIAEGQNVLISFVGIQHDTRLRANPWVLDIGEGTGKDGDTAFSFGPRICGGKQFALVELMTFLSVFLTQARFELTSQEPPVFHWKSQMLRQGRHPVRVVSLAPPGA